LLDLPKIIHFLGARNAIQPLYLNAKDTFLSQLL